MYALAPLLGHPVGGTIAISVPPVFWLVISAVFVAPVLLGVTRTLWNTRGSLGKVSARCLGFGSEAQRRDLPPLPANVLRLRRSIIRAYGKRQPV